MIELQYLVTDRYHPLGTASAIFDYFDEQVLSPLSDEEVEEIAADGADRLSAADRLLVVKMSGGHPHTTQLLADELYAAGHGAGDHLRQQGAIEGMVRNL